MSAATLLLDWPRSNVAAEMKSDHYVSTATLLLGWPSSKVFEGQLIRECRVPRKKMLIFVMCLLSKISIST